MHLKTSFILTQLKQFQFDHLLEKPWNLWYFYLRNSSLRLSSENIFRHLKIILYFEICFVEMYFETFIKYLGNRYICNYWNQLLPYYMYIFFPFIRNCSEEVVQDKSELWGTASHAWYVTQLPIFFFFIHSICIIYDIVCWELFSNYLKFHFLF